MLTLNDIARLIGAPEVPAGLDGEVEGVASLEHAGPRQLAFLVDERYARHLPATRAAAVVVGEKLAATAAQPPAGTLVLRVPDAAVAMEAVLGRLLPPADRPPPGIHPSAVVAPTARLGAEVAVGPHVVIGERTSVGDGTVLRAGVVLGEDVAIGAHCEFHAGVVVRERCTIGGGVIIHANSTIGTEGFGYRWDGARHVRQPHIGTVVIEDEVEIGSCTCIDRGKIDETRVGAGTKIDNLVQIGHNVRIGRNCILCAHVGIAGSAALGDGVILGGATGIADHSRLGDGVRAGGMSGIKGAIPAGQTLVGVPAVPYHDYLREQAALRKLPELVKTVRALAARIAELESRGG